MDLPDAWEGMTVGEVLPLVESEIGLKTFTLFKDQTQLDPDLKLF